MCIFSATSPKALWSFTLGLRKGHVQLRNGWPIRELLHTFTDFWIFQPQRIISQFFRVFIGGVSRISIASIMEKAGAYMGSSLSLTLGTKHINIRIVGEADLFQCLTRVVPQNFGSSAPRSPAWATALEKPHCGMSGLPFMKENHLVEAEPRSREIHAVSYSGIFLKNLWNGLKSYEHVQEGRALICWSSSGLDKDNLTDSESLSENDARYRGVETTGCPPTTHS